MNKIKRISITLLALIGIALSIELCIVYYNANFNPQAAPSICAISETMNCDSVAKTAYSQFFGVPLALWGLCFYLFVLFLNFVDKLQNIKFLGFLKVFKNQTSYIFCLSLFSFIISMILAAISVIKINSICIFCFMTYFIDLVIALVAKNWGNGVFFELKNSVVDFIEAIKVRRYAFWFVLLLLLAASILTYTSVSYVLMPQVAKKMQIINSFKEFNNQVYKNEIGDRNAPVVIKEYMDFNCQACFMANLYLHRLVSEMENVKVVQLNVPFEKSCHPSLPGEGHKNSCLKSKYAYAALKQNKYWEMAIILFEDDTNSEQDIIDKARLADFDIKKLTSDARGDEVKKEIEEIVQKADSDGVEGTPTFFVGMKKILGIGSYFEFRNIIQSQGGKLKKEYE